MTNVEIFFKNEANFRHEDVLVDEELTRLVVHTGPGEKSVIPLANILYYDVEETA